jgi:L-asparaginase / beta-aspartyl-peptidase
MATPLVVIHAGAGRKFGTASEQEHRSRAALIEALDAARAVLHDGGHARAAVEAAVRVLEDFELFNAGRGAVLCADGTVELSAALMSSDAAAGAVAGISRTRFPIAGAHAVLDSPQVLMLGDAADRLAAEAGAEQVNPTYFITERERGRLLESPSDPDHQTVGAVCLDGEGRLAAGTSTGGIRGQPPGRVGDCPLIGAGTWADGRVAVSCTGDGEAFIRVGAARCIAAHVECGADLAQATQRALESVRSLGGRGGLIALDADGNAVMPFNTGGMARGFWREGQEPEAWVIEEDPQARLLEPEDA